MLGLKAERVADDRDARECHCQSCEYRVQEPSEERVEQASGERDSHNIVNERPEEVLLDAAHREPRELHGFDEFRYITPKKGDACRLDGHVSPGCHGDTDVGLRQGGSVIYAVSGHSNRPAFSLQLLDGPELVFGQYLGDDFVYADLTSYVCRRVLVVAREHNDLDTELVKRSDGRLRIRFESVRDHHERQHLFLGREKYRCATRSSFFRERFRIYGKAEIDHKSRVACKVLRTFDYARDSFTLVGFEFRDSGKGSHVAFCIRSNGACDRMFGLLLERRKNGYCGCL